MALTYYQRERVVQDLIVCAQDVFFGDDLGEESKADVAQRFHEILAEEGGNIDAAYAAAAHIPPDLILLNRDIS
jgi:spectinomycin phosphotransferase